MTEEESLETKIEGLKGGDQKLAVLLGVMHNIHCLVSRGSNLRVKGLN